MAGRLWNYFDGEPYLDNPRLMLLNPQRRTKKMMVVARTRRRAYSRKLASNRVVKRNPAAHGESHRRHHRRYRRRNPVALMNPKHRRRYHHHRNPFAMNPRRYRRNPVSGTVLGFPIKDIAIAGGAIIVAPYIEKQLLALLPTSLAGTSSGLWAVKIGTAVAVGIGAKMLLGPEESRLAYIVLGANLVADAVAQFMPSLVPTATTGYYPTMNAYTLGAGPNPARPGVYTGSSPSNLWPVRPNFPIQDPFTPVF